MRARAPSAARRVTRGLHGQLVEQLGRRIVDGEYAPGQIISPDELGLEFNVSRTVIRESLRVLEAKGMLVARPNVGTRVRPMDEWNLLDPEVIDWRVHGPGHRAQLAELLELRSAIEPLAARLTAGRADDEGRRALESAFGAMRDAARLRRMDEFTAADIAFHAALLSACGNPLLAQLSVVVAAALRARRAQLEQTHEIAEEALRQHGDVVEAVAAGDEAAAEASMRLLLEEVSHA